MPSEQLRIGDPVTDLANGRTMVVVDQAADRADEWSERNDYDLCGNYGNERLGAEPDDTVYTCVYVASLQSEPSKTYDFPESRLGRPAYERADESVERVYDMVARDVLERLMAEASDINDDWHSLLDAVASSVVDDEIVEEARELADVEQTIGGEN